MATLSHVAKETTKTLLGFLGITPLEIKVIDGEDLVINISVQEEESGLLIGYHGETLSALQYVLGQIVNKKIQEDLVPRSPESPKDEVGWKRVLLNINGYRDQREVQLKQMAQNAADRAIATGNEIEMPYLTPAERRIIHLELAERTDVTSFSEGEARSRRLIIAPKKENKGEPAIL